MRKGGNHSLLSAYHDAMLSPSRMRRTKQRLGRDPGLLKEYEELGAPVNALRELRAPEPPGDYWPKVFAILRTMAAEERQRARGRHRVRRKTVCRFMGKPPKLCGRSSLNLPGNGMV